MSKIQKKIMIVDDDVSTSLILNRHLSSIGYNVVGRAASGKEAIEKARQLKPDLILMDIIMPGKIDGIKASKKIIEELDIPVIFLTAYEDDEILKRAKKVKPFGYILKPFKANEIKAAIEIALYKKEMERKLHETEEKYRSLVNTASDAIITVNRLGKIITWNRTAEKIFGYSANEVIGQSFDVIIPDRFRPAHQKGFEHVLSQEKQETTRTTTELMGRRKDGSEFPLELSMGSWKTKEGIFFSYILRDITERKGMEKILEAERFKLKEYFENLPLMAYSLSLDGEILDCNRLAIRTLGYKSKHELLGRHLLAIYAPSSQDKARRLLLRRKKIGHLRNEELQVMTKQGKIIDVLLNLDTIYDSDGFPLYNISTQLDITKRKKIEKELSASRESFHNIVEISTDGILVVDRKGKVCFANRGAEIMFNRKAEDFAGEYFGYPLAVDKSAEIEILRSDSTPGIGEMRVVKTEWQRKSASLVLIRDISERKEAEEKLRESEERAKAQYKNLPIPTYTWQKANGDFIFVDYNNALETASQGEVIHYLGAKATEVFEEMPEIRDDLFRCLREMSVFRREAQGVLRFMSERTRDFELTYTYVPPDCVMLHIEDITKKKEIDRMKSEIISNVSHELRTPLSIIREGISLILDGVLGPTREEQTDILSRVKKNIDRLTRLINDLLDVSMIEAGKMRLKKSMVDIQSLAEELVLSFKKPTAEKNIRLETCFNIRVPTIFIDPDKISQVLTNLISNSVKFTPENGRVILGIEDKESEMEISVEDTGIGISIENISRLFERFSQINRIHGPGEKGTGLGLVISKEIVEMHKGRIWVESEQGKGSKFYFSLPRFSQDEIFKEYLGTGLKEAEEKECSLGLIIISIQNFEELKRNQGDSKSAEIVQEIEDIIRRTVRRRSDIVAAYKEDCIIVFYMDITRENIQAMKEKIKETVEAETGRADWGKVISFSIHDAIYPEDAANEEDLLDKIEKVR